VHLAEFLAALPIETAVIGNQNPSRGEGCTCVYWMATRTALTFPSMPSYHLYRV